MTLARRLLSALLLFGLQAHQASAQSLDEQRAQLIVNAFNEKPDELVKPLTLAQVHLREGQGRVDVNTDAKFSYFVQTLSPGNAKSPMLLIPMATSRFTPTYYQTDAWWDAHKAELEAARRNGTPAPRQDMNEVAQWLEAQKLSTNPPVLVIDPSQKSAQRSTLQSFLRDYLLTHFAQNGSITLFRGGEKPGEIDAWLAGQKPKGARYWTPTAFYAWRYARKNPALLEELIAGRAPLFKFVIPVYEFEAMTDRRWPRLALGTELTKNAHKAFDPSGVFTDHLYQTEYLGEGTLGVEIELRSNRAGASGMARYFKGAVTVEDLALDRVEVLRRAQKRLESIRPNKAADIASKTDARINRTLAEARVLIAIREKKPREVVLQLLSELPGAQAELGLIDTVHFETFARQKAAMLPIDPTARANSQEIDREYGLAKSGRGSQCRDLFSGAGV